MAGKQGKPQRNPRPKPRSISELAFSFKPLSKQVDAHITFLGMCKKTDQVLMAIDALNSVADALQSGRVCPQEQFVSIKPGV